MIHGVQKRMSEITPWNIFVHVATFLIYLLSVKIGLYIFIQLHSSPALIWPAVGISIAAVFIGGYSLLIPIFIAHLIGLVGVFPVSIMIIASIGYTLQAFVAVYLLRKFRFDPDFKRTWDAGLLALIGFSCTAIAPLTNTIGLWLSGHLTATALLSFSRAWAGGLSSSIIITPFLIIWYLQKTPAFKPKVKVELFFAFLVLLAINYLVFWTPYASYLGITVIFVIPCVLLWFTLRFHPRWLTLALLITSIEGIAGSIIAQASPTPLNIQLLSDEIYLGFLAAMFLFFAVLVEERRAAFRQLEQNNEDLGRALQRISADDKAKTEFLAILAHELRNPLAPIVSAMEWLQLQPQTQESFQAIESAQSHAVMIRRLLDDLLDIVRVSQNKFRLNPELVSIKDMVMQSIESTIGFLQDRMHKITVNYDDETAIVFADPIRLKQILINILNNAGKYMEKGGNISVEVKKIDEWLRIKISDTGMGIPNDMLPHIFDPFRRAGPAANITTGLGIGLSLTKQLVEMHQGRIEAHSEGEGKGSVFVVYLPLPISGVTAPIQPMIQEPISAKSMVKILIIDDNEAAVIGLQKLLEHYGYMTRGSYTGESGLTEASAYKPDLILLDIGLPDTDGFVVARKLRESGYTGLIIALTGYGQHGDRAQSEEAGFDHHLVKPVGISDITAFIDKHLKGT